MQQLFKGINWSDCLTVKADWVDRFFHQVPSVGPVKVRANALSIKFSGTRQEHLALTDYVANAIEHYVYDRHQLKQFEEDEINAFRKASSFFGNTNPVKDGKYGELILYLLVEAIFKTPMVCHKISLLTNVNDQVKGGDGIFFGEHNKVISIFIGESKIYKSLGGAIDSSLDSVNRFNKDHLASSFDHELFIARSNISKSFTLDQANALYEAFRPGTEQYQACNKVFPILLIYDDENIDRIEEEATSKEHAEDLISNWIRTHAEETLEEIRTRLGKHPDLKKLFLEFFLVPMSSVENFKKTLFKQIHGIEYKGPTEDSKPPKAAKKGKQDE